MPSKPIEMPLRIVVLIAGFASLALPARPLLGSRKEPAPEALRDVGVTEHLGARLPLRLSFVDTHRQRVTLADLFDGTHPVMLTLNYSSCPMLCSLQLTGLFDAMKKIKLTLGQDYRMVTVSIDPNETPENAAVARRRYLRQYGRSGVSAGYQYLTGTADSIRQLAEAVGFRYRYVPETNEYAHAAVTVICTPDGRVSRYLYGVEYDPQTLRLSLTEASSGRIGTAVDQLLLFCFHYDPSAGKYGPSAFKLMRLAGILTVIVLAGMVVVYIRREQSTPPGNDRPTGHAD